MGQGVSEILRRSNFKIEGGGVVIRQQVYLGVLRSGACKNIFLRKEVFCFFLSLSKKPTNFLTLQATLVSSVNG